MEWPPRYDLAEMQDPGSQASQARRPAKRPSCVAVTKAASVWAVVRQTTLTSPWLGVVAEDDTTQELKRCVACPRVCQVSTVPSARISACDDDPMASLRQMSDLMFLSTRQLRNQEAARKFHFQNTLRRQRFRSVCRKTPDSERDLLPIMAKTGNPSDMPQSVGVCDRGDRGGVVLLLWIGAGDKVWWGRHGNV
jgi:hypothetical protein